MLHTSHLVSMKEIKSLVLMSICSQWQIQSSFLKRWHRMHGAERYAYDTSHSRSHRHLSDISMLVYYSANLTIQAKRRNLQRTCSLTSLVYFACAGSCEWACASSWWEWVWADTENAEATMRRSIIVALCMTKSFKQQCSKLSCIQKPTQRNTAEIRQ